MKGKSRTARYYAENPEAYQKKIAYETKRNKSKKQRRYRAELARERRARGIMGKGGSDVSHAEGGGFKLEKPSVNRSRNGHNGKSRKAPGRGTKRSSR